MSDTIGMLEHAYYSVISPEGCSSILWKDGGKTETAAAALKMQVENLIPLGLVDAKIAEPPGGAHIDPAVVYRNVSLFIENELERLQNLPVDLLLETRYQKFRKMGRFSFHETSI